MNQPKCDCDMCRNVRRRTEETERAYRVMKQLTNAEPIVSDYAEQFVAKRKDVFRHKLDLEGRDLDEVAALVRDTALRGLQPRARELFFSRVVAMFDLAWNNQKKINDEMGTPD